MKAGSAWLEAASLGSYDSQGTQWIARYRDGTWSSTAVARQGAALENLDTRRSALLEASYPHLGCGIRALGVSDLEYCVLGPRPDFYARWKGGECYYHARDNVRTQLAAIDGSKIAAVAFGYGGAFIMSYGFGPETLSYWYNLRGYYPYMDQFMQSHWPVRILVGIYIPVIPIPALPVNR
ncbi:hypothetical protein NEMBOFW57_007800 [Staphylotrichum longicolle]|uniref:Uncharacterized protein n=1 Tax=Staphylotrichum longicolle TaxID=669026 RepID=A0AAD4EVE5_9PEZI|nr:hypothetical protein NEMBOFW57_007800 [Staphylotrichum longicolle]